MVCAPLEEGHVCCLYPYMRYHVCQHPLLRRLDVVAFIDTLGADSGSLHSTASSLAVLLVWSGLLPQVC